MTAAERLALDIEDRVVLSIRTALADQKVRSVGVFIDPTLGDPLSDESAVQEALKAGLLMRHSLPRIHDDIDPGASPYLLYAPSEEPAERAISATVRLAVASALEGDSPLSQPRAVCAWIVGDSDPRARAAALARVARVRRPDGEPWPLRFWDPRVLWHLPRVLRSEQWQSIESALGHWLTLDMGSSVKSFAPSEGDRGEASSLHFDTAQWQRLQRIGAINVVLASAWEWDLLPTQRNAERIEHLLATCETLGFPSQRDGQIFVACGLTSHDRFHEHPLVGSALQQAASKGEGAATALTKFDETFWGELRQHFLQALAKQAKN